MATRGKNGALARSLLEAIRKDPLLRDELVLVLGDGVATKSDIAQVNERLDRQGEILGRHTQVIEKLVRAVEEQGRRIEVAFLHVDALGARWGFRSEAAFLRKAELYERVTGKKADRMIVTPSLDDAAREFAGQVGIEVSTDLE